MFTIYDHIYDPQRLIFYPNNLKSEEITIINQLIQDTENFDKYKQKLERNSPDKSNINISDITQAGICLTNSCNLHCNYCGDNVTNNNISSLNIDDIKIFIQDILKHWKLKNLVKSNIDPLEITLSGGGEPTFNWELFKNTVSLIKNECVKNHVPINLRMTTNGVLDDNQRKFIAQNFSYVMVSYDGIPELQNKNRISIDYPKTSDIVEGTILYFIKEKLNFTIRTTIWQDDCNKLRKMVDYMYNKFGSGISWSILPVLPVGRAMNKIEHDEDRLLQNDFLANFIDAVKYAKKYPNMSISSPMFSNQLIAIFCSGMAFNCACPWLLPNKTIITCIDSPNTKTIIGNIENGTLTYYSSCVDHLLEASIEMYTKCHECIAYRFCRGGCPAKRLMELENNNKLTNWECLMVQKYWEYIFKEILNGKECFGCYLEESTNNTLKSLGVLHLKLKNVGETVNEIKQC